MNIAPFRAYYPNLALIEEPDTFFATVKYNFADYREQGLFHRAEKESFYICEIRGQDLVRTGLFVGVDIEEYLSGRIIPHEETITENEARITDLLMQRQAMIKPVLLTYPPQEKIDALIHRLKKSTKPMFRITFAREKQEHIIYQVSANAEIKRIRELFSQTLYKAYIADGHHRCSSSASLYTSLRHVPEKAESYRYLLCAFFAFDQLTIHDYNRVVDITGGMSPTAFLARLSEVCQIRHLRKPRKPAAKHDMALYLNQEWFLMRWKKSVLKKYRKETVVLDAEILNREVLGRILRISDVRNDDRLSYVDGIAGIRGVADKTGKGNYRIGFVLYPVTMEELTITGDAGETLPPKTTWFEPRVKNGVISRVFS